MSYQFKYIKKSDHFKRRCKLRKISDQDIDELINEYDELFFDNGTNYLIFLKKKSWIGKDRNIILVAQIKDEGLHLISFHPLKENQKENRIKSGRWVKYEKK